MLVYIGGEDLVTKSVAKKLVKFVCPDTTFEYEDISPRDYGAKALENLGRAIKLGETSAVVCVFDSDGECVLSFLRNHTKEG